MQTQKPTVELYWIDTNLFNNENNFRSAYAMLSDNRREKIDTFKFRNGKNLSLGAGVLLDYGLRQYNLREKSTTLIYGENEKPYLATVKNLYFNLSHTETIALAAFAPFEVGVDIEHIRTVSDDLIRYVTTENEWNYFSSLTQSTDRFRNFNRLWCAKESFLKYIGSGLSIAPKTIEIQFNPLKIINQSAYLQEFFISNYIGCLCTPTEVNFRIHECVLSDVIL